jgi:hypothetical protein
MLPTRLSPVRTIFTSTEPTADQFLFRKSFAALIHAGGIFGNGSHWARLVWITYCVYLYFFLFSFSIYRTLNYKRYGNNGDDSFFMDDDAMVTEIHGWQEMIRLRSDSCTIVPEMEAPIYLPLIHSQLCSQQSVI